MIIAQISDTHILAQSSDQGAGRAENLRQCVADINRQGVDAVIHTGDSVHQARPEEYAHLREILAGLQAPLFLVPGNRDRSQAFSAAFGNLPYLPPMGEYLHYTVEEFPVRLVGLDSTEAGERKGVFDAGRQAWLEQTLSQEPETPTILFIHHPPFDIGQHYVGGYRHQQDADDLAAVVAHHPQVKQLLCGHVHCLYRTDWAGTVATTMPSVAVDLRTGPDGGLNGAPGYVLHAVSPKGDVASRMQKAAD
jgi:3',5'-cyclic-AMP phosphodiesterase